jgi:hypothetical protein
MFVSHRHQPTVTNLPLIPPTYTVCILRHTRQHSSCPGTFRRMQTYYAIQQPRSGTHDTVHTYTSRLILGNSTCLWFVKCTQKFRANTSILRQWVVVAFIFPSFWWKFFVHHPVPGRGRRIRSFFLNRTCYVSFTRLSYKSCFLCPRPPAFFTSLSSMWRHFEPFVWCVIA